MGRLGCGRGVWPDDPETEFLTSPSGIATAQVSMGKHRFVLWYSVDGILERGVGGLAYAENVCYALADPTVRTHRAPLSPQSTNRVTSRGLKHGMGEMFWRIRLRRCTRGVAACRRCHLVPPWLSVFESLPAHMMTAKPDQGISARLFLVTDTSEAVSVSKRAAPKLRMLPHSAHITEDWRK